MVTLVKVLKNSKHLGKYSPAACISTAFLVLPNFYWCYHYFMETRKHSLLLKWLVYEIDIQHVGCLKHKGIYLYYLIFYGSIAHSRDKNNMSFTMMLPNVLQQQQQQQQQTYLNYYSIKFTPFQPLYPGAIQLKLSTKQCRFSVEASNHWELSSKKSGRSFWK